MGKKKFEYVNEAARSAMLDLPKDIRIQFAFDLLRVQEGKSPVSDFKHLSGIGEGVVELIENGSPAYRAIYCAKFEDTVFILHAFTKTTNGVDRKAMATVEARYKLLIQRLKKRLRLGGLDRFDSTNNGLTVEGRPESKSRLCQIADQPVGRKQMNLAAHQLADPRLGNIERPGNLSLAPLPIFEDIDQCRKHVRAKSEISSFRRIIDYGFENIVEGEIFGHCGHPRTIQVSV